VMLICLTTPCVIDHCRLTVVDPAFVIRDRPRRHCQPLTTPSF
jgi:hypothetical protein